MPLSLVGSYIIHSEAAGPADSAAAAHLPRTQALGWEAMSISLASLTTSAAKPGTLDGIPQQPLFIYCENSHAFYKNLASHFLER
jgi:hypothetical protein